MSCSNFKYLSILTNLYKNYILLCNIIDELCKEDHIVIEASTSQCGSLIDTSNRYCGQHLADSTMTLANLEICGKFINTRDMSL